MRAFNVRTASVDRFNQTTVAEYRHSAPDSVERNPVLLGEVSFGTQARTRGKLATGYPARYVVCISPMAERGRYHVEELEELRAKWPDWQIWTVPTWDGYRNGMKWCARRGDTWLRAWEPQHLSEYIADQSWPDP